MSIRNGTFPDRPFDTTLYGADILLAGGRWGGEGRLAALLRYVCTRNDFCRNFASKRPPAPPPSWYETIWAQVDYYNATAGRWEPLLERVVAQGDREVATRPVVTDGEGEGLEGGGEGRTSSITRLSCFEEDVKVRMYEYEQTNCRGAVVRSHKLVALALSAGVFLFRLLEPTKGLQHSVGGGFLAFQGKAQPGHRRFRQDGLARTQTPHFSFSGWTGTHTNSSFQLRIRNFPRKFPCW